MNAIVLVALRRPLTFVVMSILIILFGTMAVLKTPTDIFPGIRIPVVAVVWNYNGLSPQDMSGRVVYYYERALTATVANVEHIESESLYGAGVVKVFFQPGTDIAAAQAQVTAVSQTVLKQMPAGITPPQILVYNASSVPVLDLQVSASNMTSAQVYDMASNLIRPQLVSVPGVSIPNPYGGTSLNVEIDLDQAKLLAHGLSASDVAAALSAQNVVLPAGDQKIGGLDYMVQTNSTPLQVDTFNNMPIKTVNGATVYLHDVAYVHRGAPPQTNAVLVKGRQSVLIQIYKSGNASTLSVVAGIKKALPGVIRTLPAGVKITPLNDASGFVRDSVLEVVQEMITAALLTGAIVLLFLGSWRSTLIVATSIPLAILTSILVLHYTGQTINVMTLGGLALAVGILVDDATVMIENIDSHLETGVELEEGIITAANQIVVPTLVATLCICIVWLPLFQLDGISGYLFRPLAEAIIYAMLASFVLSRTLVPTMAAWLLRGQVKSHGHGHGHGHELDANAGFFTRFQRGFERKFTQFREGYRGVLTAAVLNRKRFIMGFLDMHIRAPIGMRLEDASKISVLVNGEIRKLLPGQVNNVVDNCGLPSSSINLAYTSDGTIGPQDCDISITLKNEQSPVDDYRLKLRRELPKLFPGTVFSFLPGDITAKILNFGLPAPIDVQVSGRAQAANMAYAQQLAARIRQIPGAADVNIEQAFNEPTIKVAADRSLASGMNLSEANIANNALATLSGSGQTAPTYWLDTTTGVSHLVNMQTPQDQLTSMNDLETIPIDTGNGDPGGQHSQLLGALGTVTQTGTPLLVSHYNIMPSIDIFVSNQGRDLGAVYDQVQEVIKEMNAQVPHGASVHVRGQATTMSSAYTQLLEGLALSILLVYLVIVVNFQSWLDPFIIITALPGAIAGIVWSLFLTHTNGSVPALTGAIMCMGTATANSILVVSYARERLAEHGDAITAAIEAGYARIRPVLMTATAMIIGMLPMSMSNTQNAPLGRAVIGGLLVATFATLLFVPCVFALMHRNDKNATESHL
jgi:multidrug efflux pump subunit AcrB